MIIIKNNNKKKSLNLAAAMQTVSSDVQKSYWPLLGGSPFWPLEGGTFPVYHPETWGHPREGVGFPRRQAPGPAGVPCYDDHASSLGWAVWTGLPLTCPPRSWPGFRSSNHCEIQFAQGAEDGTTRPGSTGELPGSPQPRGALWGVTGECSQGKAEVWGRRPVLLVWDTTTFSRAWIFLEDPCLYTLP